jgi:ATP-dependent RNA helicase RhlE
MSFSSLQLIDPILKALTAEGYTTPTPVQSQSIPVVLSGKDLLSTAQTGTGKTAAFAIPIIQMLHAAQAPKKALQPIKALILTPTRELAIQIGESFAAYGKYTKLTHSVIYGGVSQHSQTDALRKGVDILISTPGRLLDLINQRFIHLQHIEFFVLDEADRMLDMGFINDIKKVIARLPLQRQTLFFSATMPPQIQQLAGTILKDPVHVAVSPVSSTAEKVKQAVYMVDKTNKRPLLIHLLKEKDNTSTLVFTRTKHGADRVAKELNKYGIAAEAIHGDKSQNARQRALSNFKNKQIRVLVATDIAARGIDIEELPLVINYELPNDSETYVHRIGRTGRAGASGYALSFCDAEERDALQQIHKLIGKTLPVIKDHPYTPRETEQPQTARKEANARFTRRPASKPRERYSNK